MAKWNTCNNCLWIYVSLNEGVPKNVGKCKGLSFLSVSAVVLWSHNHTNCNFFTGPLMMIVEFCKYGNLSNYLRGKRDDFLVYKVSRMIWTPHVSTTILSSSVCKRRREFNLVSFGQMQSPDGKVVSAGSGCELSELMKRRLESVASTGSSASSGFIEDKSYCDSEEEEEGKGFPSTPPPSSSSSSSLFVPHSSPQIVFRSDGTFPPPVQQHNHCRGSRCHPHRARGGGGICLFPVLTQHVSHVVSDVLFQIWLTVYTGGAVEGLLGSCLNYTHYHTFRLRSSKYISKNVFSCLIGSGCLKDETSYAPGESPVFHLVWFIRQV